MKLLGKILATCFVLCFSVYSINYALELFSKPGGVGVFVGMLFIAMTIYLTILWIKIVFFKKKKPIQ